MKRRMISLLGVVLLLFVTLPINAVAGPPSGVPATTSDFSSQQILVKFKSGTSLPEAAEIHRQLGGQAKGTVPGIGVQVVTVPKGQEMAKAKAYSSNPRVAYAEPDYIAQALAEPDDTYFDKQWGMEKVQAPEAWAITTGSSQANIAILDTGVDPEHPDLIDKIVDNVNFTDSPTADDVYGHGTHVAGIAAASTNNGIGVAGLGYDSTIMNVKVLRDNGSGYHSWIAAGIIWAADNGARIINLSLGGGDSTQVLEDAVNYAWSKGAVVVAAAGNNGNSHTVYPAAYTNCIAVAATDTHDALASWSNYGDWVDVAAPGTGIYSTLNSDSYGYKAGTSMASPHVAGLAALVFATVSDANGDGKLNDEVRSRIEATCDDIGVSGIGSGRINAATAVQGDEIVPQPDVQIVEIADPVSVSEAGTVVTYTYTVSNTGDITLTGIAVTDDKLGNIAVAATTLDPGAATSGTAAYTVSQADIDSGADIVNIATVTTDQGVTSSDTATVSILQEPAISIEKSADATTVSETGTVITYTYTVSNTGDVTLTGIAVSDDKLGDIAVAATALHPGAATHGTATYTITQADIDSGADIVNIATVTTGQGVTDDDTSTVTILQQPEVQIVEIADPTSISVAGTVITYTYTVSNTGDVTLTGIAVTDDKLGDIALAATTLDPGAATTGTATYTVTQADIDSGADIVNTVTVTTGQGVTDDDTATVTVLQQPEVQIVEIADPVSVSETGTVVTYTYTVSNTGDVTLTGIAVTDDKLGDIAVAATALDPGAATHGTAAYTVTQADIDSGADIVNTATVTTDQGVTAQDSATVRILQQPAIGIEKIADATTVSVAGTVVTYTYTVSNTGDVTLTGIAVIDDKLGSIALAATTLDPGAATSGTAAYTVSQADIDSGADIVNTATVTTEQGVTASDSATVSILQEPAISIEKTADATTVSEAGTVITYTYTVSNTGDVTLTGIAVSDDKLGDIALATTALDPGAATSGTATYTVSQADIDSGADIVNTATVTTDQGVTDSDSATVSIEIPEVTEVTISPADSSDRGWPGEDVLYIFTVENSGNVADTYDISVTSAWASSVAPQSLALEPSATATITVTHSVPDGVSPGDFDSGTVEVFSSETGASASASFTTTARVSAVEITPGQQTGSAAPGETVQYTYTISNTGTEDDVYDLVISATWEASLTTTSVSLQAGTSAQVVVSHIIPADTAGDTSDVGILTAGSEKASASATFATTAQVEEEPAAPVIDLFNVSNTSNPVWARAAVEWAVSHEDGNLATVEILMVLDGEIVDSAVFSVSGYDASGRRHLRNRDSHGRTYEITLIVTDTDGNTSHRTESIVL